VILPDLHDLILYSVTLVAVVGAYVFFMARQNALRELKTTRQYSKRLERATDQTIAELLAEIDALTRLRDIRDAEVAADPLRSAAQSLHEFESRQARTIQATAECDAAAPRNEPHLAETTARERPEALRTDTNRRAQQATHKAGQRVIQLGADG
jgi:hypothetical protein